MSSVDNRIVQMQFDNAKFENGVSTSINSIEKLKQALQFNDAGKGFDNITKAANSVDLSTIQNGIGAIEQKFSIVSEAIRRNVGKVIDNLIGKATQLANAMFVAPRTDGFKEYELKMGSVQTIMASTGATLEEVNSYLDELNTYADKTIYSFSDMTANIGKFTNAGVKLDVAVKAIQGISNEAAVSGANAAEASRAMYNFAQALSSGAVKLIDWKSIENANMATVEFKQELLDTALALGTVVKDGDKYRSVTTDLSGKVSEAFTATSLFNESLAHQWLTTDVLTTTLGRYADASTELGKKAFAAAQDVKTWSQLLDTLKEAMGSGWSQSFEILIGDFNEAKELFTMISNTLGGIIDKSAKVRNGFLRMWDDKGGREKLIKQLETILGNIDTLYDKALKNILGSKYNKLIGDVNKELGETSSKITDVTEAEKDFVKAVLEEGKYGTGEERRKEAEKIGLNYERVSTLIDEVASGSKTIDDISKSISENTKEAADQVERVGETKLSKTLSNLFATTKLLGRALLNVGEAVKNVGELFFKAFMEEFNMDGISGDVRGFARTIVQLTGKLRDWTKNNETIFSTFKALFRVLNNVWVVIKAIIDILSGNGSYAIDYIRQKADGLLAIIDKFTGLSISDNIKNLIKNIKQLGITIYEAFKSKLSSGDLIPDFSRLSKDVKPIDILKNGLEKLFEIVKKVGTILTPIIKSIGSGIFKTLQSIDISGLLKTFGEAGLVGLIFKLKESIGNFESATGIFEEIKNTLTGFQEQLKSNVLMKIAIAVALLVGSIVVLSGVDTVSAGAGIASIVILINQLTSAVEKMSAISGGKGLLPVTSALMKLSVAVLIISFAVKTLSKIDGVGIAKGLGAVIVLLYAMTEMMTKMSKDINSAVKGSSAFILLAISIGILASVIKKFEDVSWETIGKGLATVVILMFSITEMLTRLQISNPASAGMGLILFATAIKILTSAVKSMADLSWEELLKGLVGVGVLLFGLSLAMSHIDNSQMIQTGIGMVLVATSIRILTDSVKEIGELKWSEIIKGLVGVGALLVEMAFAVKIMKNSNPMSAGAGLILVSVALEIVTDVLLKLATLSWEELIKGIVTIAAVIVELGAALMFFQGTIAGALALTIASTGILLLATALSMVAVLPISKLITSILTLAIVIGALVAAALLITPIVPILLATATAMALLGVGVLALALGIDILVVSLAALAAAGFGLMLITSFMDDLESAMPGLVDKGVSLIITFIQSLADAMIDHSEELANALVELIIGALLVLGQFTKKFLAAGWNIVKNIGTGIKQKAQEALMKVVGLGVDIINEVTEWKDGMIAGAKALIDGFIQGIKDKWNEGIQMIKDFGTGVLDEFKAILGIESPSKEFKAIGEYADLGFVKGIDGFSGKVTDSTKKLANSAIDSMAKPLSHITDILNGNLIVDPTIRPVLDLTELQNGTGMINDMFANRSVQLAGATAKLNDFNSTMIFDAKRNQNRDVVDEMRSLRSDVNALADKMDTLQVVMDSGQLVGAISSPMDAALGQRAIRKGRRN